jgi:hypothetical protein
MEDSSESPAVSVESKPKRPKKRRGQSPPENGDSPKKAARERGAPSERTSRRKGQVNVSAGKGAQKKFRGTTKTPVKISTGRPNIHPLWNLKPLSLTKGVGVSSSSSKKGKKARGSGGT